MLDKEQSRDTKSLIVTEELTHPVANDTTSTTSTKIEPFSPCSSYSSSSVDLEVQSLTMSQAKHKLLTAANADAIVPESSPLYYDLRPFVTFNSSHRLDTLRSLMRKLKLTAYIVPSEDEHQSEYTAPKDQRRSFISGFTGSSGVAIITMESASLATDGRYFLQAGRQLDNNWQLLKEGVSGYPSWEEWVVDEVLQELRDFEIDQGHREIGSIGVDPRLINISTGLNLKERCFNANIRFATIMELNLVDRVMQLEHYTPEQDKSMIFKHELQYSGETTSDKLIRIKSFMKDHKYFSVVVSALDEIAWLLNLRGNDIAFNPVFFCYVIITTENVLIYIDRSKLTSEIKQYLLGCCENLKILDYKQFWHDLPGLDSNSEDLQTICTQTEASYALYTTLPSVYEIECRSVLAEFKGIKNGTEISGNRKAQLKDSVALCQTFAWLEEQLHSGVKLTEIEVADRATYYRGLQSNFRGLSFATISASGANSSVIHYEPTESENAVVDSNKVFLMDSGAQFLEGTTDITRTYHFGKPTELERKLFSLVLSGHLNVAMLDFAQGTSSYYIDSLARKPLLKEGLGYSHGTGHGIDTYICVHSGPCGLSPAKTSYNYKPLEPGNFLSDEPGCYLDNRFGVRIESDVLVVSDEPVPAQSKCANKPQLHFEYMTLVPFGLNLIDRSYFTETQISWINNYHKNVREHLSPYLEAAGDQRAVSWLERETRDI
ncbi:hypothetical protein FOA43_001604 [Brettanomyces nanus]|uniref:Xaa-Pro aminopeptidase n=1 Tax=Eeniella nana TaxID=13502 RepID=A0A875S394_EENNA|nr:uncharacterized protein FOA43_001604 [Brettanomyces nanus]QPG74279.1 hypothetical protein FOA43_001604 [Brettanomyces nanus]